MPGPAEILVILVIALLVLGPQRLPEAARQVGKAMAEFRRITSGFQAELRDALHEADQATEPEVASAPPPSLPPLPEEIAPPQSPAPAPGPATPAAAEGTQPDDSRA